MAQRVDHGQWGCPCITKVSDNYIKYHTSSWRAWSSVKKNNLQRIPIKVYKHLIHSPKIQDTKINHYQELYVYSILHLRITELTALERAINCYLIFLWTEWHNIPWNQHKFHSSPDITMGLIHIQQDSW